MIASYALAQWPLPTNVFSSRCASNGNAKAKGRQPTSFGRERHVTCCDRTSQSAEDFYEFLLDQQASIIQGAVNVSKVQGTLTPERATTMSGRGRGIDPKGGQPYSAAALSLVYHPANPFVPTLRADVRLFQVEDQSWYGGGCDLTPAYLFEDDACRFHRHWKATCDKHDAELYPGYKTWCDDYFYIPARQEHRGIGGIFFDDLEAADAQFDVAQFVQDVAQGFIPSWQDIATERAAMLFTDKQRQWQLLRRGRYLEFNLLYDRGVKFGLSGGRLESIMVSAPPLIAWRYNVVPEDGSPEAKITSVLKKPVDWASL